MTSTPDAASVDSPYHGQALKPGEIRLLNIIWTTSDEFELSTECHELTKDLEFDAISYVWGFAPAFVNVKCNDSTLAVTPTAFEMLGYLYLFKPNPKRPIWVDAICINQSDADEKAVQVPLMHRIFSHACSVLTWAGRSTVETDIFVSDLSHSQENWDCEPGAQELLRRWPTSATDLGPFWTGLAQLMSADWFVRLWTFQEAVLAKEGTMLCGRFHQDLFKLLRLAVITYNASWHAFGSAGSLNFRWEIQWDRILRQRHRGPISLYSLPSTLNLLRGRDVEEEVDRIWALYGLFDDHLQSLLVPMIDYSETARSRPWRTLIECMKIVIKTTESFDKLLEVDISRVTKRAHFPSWCPDFSKRDNLGQAVFATWRDHVQGYTGSYKVNLVAQDEEKEAVAFMAHDERRHTMRCIELCEDRDVLSIRGFEIDEIVEVIEDLRLIEARWSYVSSNQNLSHSNPTHTVAMEWLSKGLDLARRVCQQHKEKGSDVPWEFLMAFSTDHRVDETTMLAFEDAKRLLMAYDSSSFLLLKGLRQERASAAVTRFRRIFGHSFFSTVHGHFGLATPGCKVGDKVSVLYGGKYLYIVRPQKEKRDPGLSALGDLWELVSTAYIPYLMDQHMNDDARQGPDQMYNLA
jgi:hypothetical protein